MGYFIEISFNVLKNSNATEILKNIKNVAFEYKCLSFYEDYEFETHVAFKRNHCVMFITFNEDDVQFIVKFLNFIKKTNGLFIELLYNEKQDNILYASQYYILQKMDKTTAKLFKKQCIKNVILQMNSLKT